MSAPLNLEDIYDDLQEVRANVAHGDAQHNPWALQALRAADRLLTEVEHLRVELAAARAEATRPEYASDPGE